MYLHEIPVVKKHAGPKPIVISTNLQPDTRFHPAVVGESLIPYRISSKFSHIYTIVFQMAHNPPIKYKAHPCRDFSLIQKLYGKYIPVEVGSIKITHKSPNGETVEDWQENDRFLKWSSMRLFRLTASRERSCIEVPSILKPSCYLRTTTLTKEYLNLLMAGSII